MKELLTAGAVDVLQTDPDWTGGITELARIAALASAFDVPRRVTAAAMGKIQREENVGD